MAVLEVVKYPDPRLREETFPVAEITDDIRQLVEDMRDTMYALNGAGIAAIQVGRLEQIFLLDGKVAGATTMRRPSCSSTPRSSETGKGLTIAEEGCLSFPESSST